VTNYPAGADAYTVTQSMADPDDGWETVIDEAKYERVKVRTAIANELVNQVQEWLYQQGVEDTEGMDQNIRLRRIMGIIAHQLPLTDKQFAQLAVGLAVVNGPVEPDGWSF